MEADRTTAPGATPDAMPARAAGRPQRRSRLVRAGHRSRRAPDRPPPALDHVREKGTTLRRIHVAWVPLPVKEDEPAAPVGPGAPGTDAAIPRPHGAPNLLRERRTSARSLHGAFLSDIAPIHSVGLRSRNARWIGATLPSIPVSGIGMPERVGLRERINAFVGVENSGRDGRQTVMLRNVDQHDSGEVSVVNCGVFPSSNSYVAPLEQ